MEKCYEYFNCKEHECPARKIDVLNCWDIENTLYHHPSLELMVKNNINKCDYCQFYKSKNHSVSKNK